MVKVFRNKDFPCPSRKPAHILLKYKDMNVSKQIGVLFQHNALLFGFH
jgi:hypothetical protein